MEFLKTLGIETENYGACAGPGQWSKTRSEGQIESYNPGNAELISSV